MKKAVVLLSGGLDSSTLLYYVKSKGYKPYCLIFDYGQRHIKEIKQAIKIARLTGSEYIVEKLSLPWKGSSLIGKTFNIPVHTMSEIGKTKELPSTYVPGRNTIFISYALSLAEAKKSRHIFIGANAIDFSGYPDCRPEYFKAWNKLIASLRLKNSIKIEAPFVKKTKAEIIKLGLELEVPYNLTWSCYSGGQKPCMKCDSCKLRCEAFKKAGIKDAV